MKLRWVQHAVRAGATALFCLVLPNRGLALDPTKDIAQYNCQTWTRQNGLPGNGINAITQTKDGYLWLGTHRGLVRFDGVQFAPFSLPEGLQFQSETISSVAGSRSSGLWFGIVNGSIGFYDDEKGFSSLSDVKWVDPKMNVITVLESNDGALWVGTDKGVVRSIKGNPSATIINDQLSAVRGISEDSQGRVWLVTARDGLYYWQTGKIIAFPDDSLKRETIITAVADHEGQIWVGTSSGLRCYGTDFRRKEIPRFSDEVKALLVDGHGMLWIGTAGDGLARYKNGAFSFVRKADGLADNIVASLFEDREGSLWIGTRGGLSQLTDVKFPTYSAAEGLLGGLCHAVSASARGGLWVATSEGVSYFNGSKAINYSDERGLSSRYIKRALEAKNGDVYLINGKMAVDILSDGKGVATFTNNSWPTALVEDSQGVIVSVSDQLYRISRDGMVPYVFKSGQAPVMTWIRNLLVSRDGSLWVASVTGILRIKEGAVQRWSTDNGLSNNDVYNLCEDADGTIWAGLTTGLARIKGDQVHNIGRRDGLLDDSLFAIVPDDHDNLWINSNRGIFRASRRELSDFCDGKTHRVHAEFYNGINVVKTSDNTEAEYVGCKTLDGRIWFPSPLGAVAIDPSNILANQNPPLVRVESVRANGKDFDGHNRHVVPPGPGELEFHFTALSFIAPQQVKFRYRLEGYDSSWVETENRRIAFYTNLDPGHYTFHVTAANADGIWNKTGDTMEIELRPYFFQATWFYMLCGGFALSLLAGAYLWRIRLLKRKEESLQKNRIFLETEVQTRTAELQRENAERERAEAALRMSQGFLQSLVENLPVNIFRNDREGRITFANKAFCERLRLPLEQILGKTAFDFLPREKAEHQHQVELQIMKTGRIYEATEEQPSVTGEPVFLQMIKVPVRDDGGNCIGVQGMFLDVTSRERAEEELRAKTALLEAQFDSSIDGILVVDPTGKKAFQNQRTIDLLKIPLEIANEVDDRNQLQFVVNSTKHPDQFIGKVEYLLSHPNESSRDEIEFKDGRVLDRYSAPVVGKDGRHYGRIWAFRDITERKQAEADLNKAHRQLLETSRLTGMAEVATSVLHNVGNVLNSVNVSANLLVDQVRQTKSGNLTKVVALFDQHKADLSNFLTQDPRGQIIPSYLSTLADMLVTEQKTLITELGHLSKNIGHIKEIVSMQQAYAHTSGVTEAVSITDLIEDALRITANSLGRHEIDVVRDYQAHSVIVTDKHKVMQILINLVRNAKEACKESVRSNKQLTVRTAVDDHRIKISVIDNGVGIPAENLTRIFNHGFTTRKEGHGFGLHSSALAAKELGGSILAQSAGPGQGATFILELPNTPTAPNPS